MSLYSDPAYFLDQRQDLSAPLEVPDNVQDLDTAFKDVLDVDNYNELELLRKVPAQNNQMEKQQLAASQRTNVEMPLSCERFGITLREFGYPREASMVVEFLKGVGEYDHATKQTYFKLRDIYNYH